MEKNARKKLVIIGNGMAGNACLEELLKSDCSRFEVTVFGAETRNYNRVLLSQVLTGEKTLRDITLHDLAWYKERGIRLFTGSKVTAVKRGSRIVHSTDGTEAGYDKLILATGAIPVIPRIPGMEKEGVIPFRNIDDCEKIRGLSKRGAKAVVIGGGLLGLEAAHGLLSLGLKVTVVHLMGRLMERQLDEVAADLLREDLKRMGIEVLTGKETVEIFGDKRVEGLRFRDGGTVPADMAVLSVGIRPNIELAGSSGIYCEKGIVVSDTMQTYDPAVYAVGECVQHRGATFGLVAPIFEQARVLSNHLAGDSRLVFKGQPTSTRLKIPGVDLYSAGTVDDGRVESIEYIDRGSRLYKKLFIKDARIKGVIMYGETGSGPALFSSLLEGEDISQRRNSLLTGGLGTGRLTASIEEMPDETIICGCNGVTKGDIVKAIEDKGLFTREDVKRETKASSSCGGCGSLVDQILEATLGSSFEGGPQPASICACTKYSRDDIIKNIREKRLKSVKEVMETLGWETVGCDRCRPALNYYVSVFRPEEYEDDQTSRVINERAHANIQKDGTFSVVPRMYGGITSPGELKKIADVAIEYGIPLIKLTGGQRIDLLGVKKEDLPGIWEKLGMDSGYAYGKALRTVKTCVGNLFCRFGTQDSLNLGVEIERYLKGLWTPAKVKMSVSGCPRNCAESRIKDIGIVGVTGGWEIYLGGCGGIELKAGEYFCTVKEVREVIETASALLQYYREDAHYGERMFKWIMRRGLKDIKKAVINDTEHRNRLCHSMERALSVVKDPWKEKIERTTRISA